MTDYTPNFNLDLYESTDKPNLRDQYNSAMRKIDTKFGTQDTSIAALGVVANDAKALAQSNQDAISNEISAREIAIATEQASRESADNSINNRLDQLANSLSNSNPFKNKKVIWLGDSWSMTGVYGVTTAHQTIVAEKLGFGEMYGSYVGGRGYIYGAETFIQSLQAMDANSEIPNDEISYIIIDGSCNDGGRSGINMQNIVDAMTDTFDYCKLHFTNAEIIVIPTCGNNTQMDGFVMAAIANRRGAVVNGVKYIRGGQWLLHSLPVWNNDNVHPTQTGQNYLGYAMAIGLLTGNMNIRNYFKTFSNSDIKNPNGGIPFNYESGIITSYYPLEQLYWFLVDDTVFVSSAVTANGVVNHSAVKIGSGVLQNCMSGNYRTVIGDNSYPIGQQISAAGYAYYGEGGVQNPSTMTAILRGTNDGIDYFVSGYGVGSAYVRGALFKVAIGVND